MSIKAGSVLQIGRNVILDRIQAAGPGQVSIPEEKVRELGNFKTVGTVLDTPDVTYSLESFDASCELEALFLGRVAADDSAGQEYDLALCKPLDVVGQFKPDKTAASPFTVVGSAAAPYLMPESIEYRFGVTDNGSISGSLRGDAIYYSRGTAYIDEIGGGARVVNVSKKKLTANVATLTVGEGHGINVGESVTVAGVDATFNGSATVTVTTPTTISYAKTSADVPEAAATGTVTATAVTLAASTPYTLEHTAYPYEGDSTTGTRYTLSVQDSTGERYRLGVDYTENPTGAGDAKTVAVTLTGTKLPGAGNKLFVVYTSDVAATYDQLVHAAETATRPAAVRGRNVVVKIGGVTWTDVQSVSVSWRLQLDSDREMGNDQVVSRDYDEPEVSGTIQIKPRGVVALMTKLKQLTGVTEDFEVMGALQRAELEVEVELHSPDDGSVLKTLYVPDAKFLLPGFNARVQQKTTFDIPFTSQTGDLKVYKGAKP